ncbi:MAG: hypothetical protein BAA04_09785 [Firmicutes bacterium ZCTH02-B6]|nr:MAG: hypothetical protein BAA04_09785 [Firmicutes bacterium ZCTH02-B6]
MIYAVAKRRDLGAIARLLSETFSERLGQAGMRLPAPMLIEHSLRLFYDADPRSFLIAQQGAEIVGYAFAPHPKSALWRAAVIRGHALRWLWQWPVGWRNTGLTPLRLMMTVQGRGELPPAAWRARQRNEARLLVVAVRPDLRSRGVGTTLIRHALQAWRHRGVQRVTLPLPPDDEAARRLLLKVGFRDQDGAWNRDWTVMVYDL